MEVEINFQPPRIIGKTASVELTLPLAIQPVELYFEQGSRNKLQGLSPKGHIPRRPVCRIWIINEGKADVYYDTSSSLVEGKEDIYLTSMLRGGGESNGVSEAREIKTPENTITALFLQAQITDKNPTPNPATAFVRIETLT